MLEFLSEMLNRYDFSGRAVADRGRLSAEMWYRGKLVWWCDMPDDATGVDDAVGQVLCVQSALKLACEDFEVEYVYY